MVPSGGAAPALAPPDPRRSPPTTCTIDGWCGSLGDYAAIWGSSLFDIWVAANHVKNDRPTEINPPETPILMHWDGRQWTTTELPDAPLVQLSAIWGSSSEDVWAVGSPAYVTHYDGKRWSRSLLPVGAPIQVSSVWGTGPADVWIGGFGLFHFNGQVWSIPNPETTFQISSVWASRGDVWIVSNGLPRRSQDEGQSWYPLPPASNPSTPPPAHRWNALWSPDNAAPFVAGQAGSLGHWVGTDWVAQSFGADLSLDFTAIAGLSSSDVWAVGDWGALAHWDGTRWTQQSAPTSESLHGVWGAEGRYFAVGDHGTFLALEDSAWTGSQVTTKAIKAIWGGAPNDVWAVGRESLHWDGATWSKVDELAEVELNGVWGTTQDDVWVVGKSGALRRFDGTRWVSTLSPTQHDITGIWGSSASDVWAVAASGELLHFDGQRWALWPAENFGPLAAVHGNRANDVVAVGLGVRIHFDGQGWQRLPAHLKENPDYVSAFGDGTNVFLGGMVHWSAYKAGGANPELGRWDGSSVFDDLEPVWGGNGVVQAGWANGQSNVWIALPPLAHWDGMSWSKAGTSGTSVGVSALGATSEDVWAAVVGGPMLRKHR